MEHRQKKWLIVICLLGGMMLIAREILAQMHVRPSNSKAEDWITERWTGDDGPYKKMRDDIDVAVKSNSLSTSILRQYELAAYKHMGDPQVVFQWAYASYAATQGEPSVTQDAVPAEGIFTQAPSPHSYQYDRIRFLTVGKTQYQPELLPIGKRLLERDPNDYNVEYTLIDCFKPWQSQSEKSQALRYAGDLTKRNPTKAGPYSEIGGIYYSCWMVRHNRADAQLAISAYQNYLRRASPSNTWRPEAERIIRYISSNPSR